MNGELKPHHTGISQPSWKHRAAFGDGKRWKPWIKPAAKQTFYRWALQGWEHQWGDRRKTTESQLCPCWHLPPQGPPHLLSVLSQGWQGHRNLLLAGPDHGLQRQLLHLQGATELLALMNTSQLPAPACLALLHVSDSALGVFTCQSWKSFVTPSAILFWAPLLQYARVPKPAVLSSLLRLSLLHPSARAKHTLTFTS